MGALLYNQLGQYDLGMRYADLAFAETDPPRQRCAARQLYLEAALGLGQWPDSDDTANSAIDYCTSQGELGFSNLIRTYLAKNLARTGRKDEARLLLEAHIKEASETRYPRLISEFHSLLAEYSFDAGMLDSAERSANTALEASRNNAFSLPRVAAHRVLHEIALQRGDLQRALDEYRHYAEADKAYLDDVKARELAFQQSRNEVQQKDQAIALLSKQNEVLKLEQQVAHTSAQNTRLLLLLLGVVLAGIGYWAYKIKRVQMAFRRQAQTDGLTGISNRRHFRDAADAQLKRCGESGREAALVLLDLDNFKLINDRHGHAAGDWVLKQVAEACKAVCRDGDLCGRLGGEEFGILSCGGDADAARRIADRCRERLAAIDASQVGHDQRITASFGCTTSRRSGYVFETMFTDADTAMYRAKGSGRDRVVLHADDATPPTPPAVHGRLETSPG
ncbi:hypothetical protein C9I47_0205 [Lysobacter maris]|uniref:diguanylate cyclase n=1 Tax=Marilutibacter maris TaxID=1605891 RepID=A0A2U9T0R8_9GAMM|nr:hypothetical protein C9I47_0205 [Lysobacter maris]